MQSRIHPFRVAGAESLRNDDGGSRRKPHEKAEDKTKDLGGRTSHAGQGGFSCKTPHHHRIHGIIQLLKKSSDQDRKEKHKDLFPDDPCKHRIV